VSPSAEGEKKIQNHTPDQKGTNQIEHRHKIHAIGRNQCPFSAMSLASLLVLGAEVGEVAPGAPFPIRAVMRATRAVMRATETDATALICSNNDAGHRSVHSGLALDGSCYGPNA
jgi:hypothetical protein